MSVLSYRQTTISPSSEVSAYSTPLNIKFPLPNEPVKKSSNSVNFLDCVKLIYLPAKSAGLLPFSLNYTSNGEIKSCKLRISDIIVLVMFLSLCIGLVIFIVISSSFDVDANAQSRHNIMLVGRRAILLCGLIVSVIYYSFDFLNRNRLVSIAKKIGKLDKQVIPRVIQLCKGIQQLMKLILNKF